MGLAGGLATNGGGTPASVVLDASATPKGIDSTGIADGGALAYNAASGKFKPGSAAQSLGAAHMAPIGSIEFPRSTVYDPGGVDVGGTPQYGFAPGFCTTSDGAWLVAYLLETGHTGSDGIVYVVKSFDAGLTWTTPVVAHNPGGSGAKDPSLYREPGKRRVYLTAPVGVTVTKIRASDDDGATWTQVADLTTVSAITGLFCPAPMRRNSDGLYRIPAWKSTANGSAYLLSAAAPEGPWTATLAAGNAVGQSFSEWDYCEVTPSLWVGMFRDTAGGQCRVSVSTDQGATWATPVALNITGSVSYDGWPTPVLNRVDGSVMLFARASNSSGLRMVKMLSDPTAANLVDPNQWSESNIISPAALARVLDSNNTVIHDNATLTPYGKFQPVWIGDALVGAYYGEADAARNRSRVFVGALNMRALQAQQSYIATAESVTNASLVTLTTVDQVRIRTLGGMYRVSYRMKSQGATPGSHSMDIEHTGLRWIANVLTSESAVAMNLPYRIVQNSGTQTVASQDYWDEMTAFVELGPGVHLFRLLVQSGNARTFAARVLRVDPA